MPFSSPLRRRRQSVRTPLRKTVTLKEHAESNLDPFIHANKETEDGVLRETLLAQLNARVEADPSNPFLFDRQAQRKEDNKQASRYDGNHDRMFKSMKSIGDLSSRAASTEPVMKRPKPVERRQVTNTTVPKRALKRQETQTHDAASPSKRRKVEMVKSCGSSLPKLSFNFDRPTKVSVQTTEASDRGQSVQATVTEPRNQSQVMSTSTPPRSKSTHRLASCAEKHAMAPHEESESLYADATPNKLREQRRLEQRKKVSVQRMMMKKQTSSSRPGWK